MAKHKSTSQVFIFAFIVCVTCSLILAGAATVLKPRQEANAKLDVVQNILITVGHDAQTLRQNTPQHCFDLYEKEFNLLLIDKNNQLAEPAKMRTELNTLGYPEGLIDGLDTTDLLRKFESKKRLLASRKGQPLEEYDPRYKLVHEWQPTGTVEAYVIPIEGYGLWDMIYGYLALDADLNTVKGISFYSHKETPGLGARITEEWFKDQYKGKTILNPQGKLVSVNIVRGKVADLYQGDATKHYVDGISGATLTGKGINDFMAEQLEQYEPFFKIKRKATMGGDTL